MSVLHASEAAAAPLAPARPLSGSLVSLRGVAKEYPKISSSGDRLRTLAALLFRRKEIPHFSALEGIDLEVRRGESLGIIGENGAGKSTLLKVITGVVRPTRGEVHVRGRIGALLELGSGFHPEYTGRENIYLSSALMGIPRRAAREKLDEIIEFADIGPHIDEPIKHYSSGMVVRLGFAVATALEPELLITDEVLAVGDESFQKKCIAWLESYLAAGGTLLMCSHSMYHVQTLCRRAVWIHHGRIRMEGNSFDVTREYLTYHEEKNANRHGPQRVAEGNVPRILDGWTERPDGKPESFFRVGDTMVLQGIAYHPDDRPPIVLFGIVRADGTPVYGSHCDEAGFEPVRIAPRQFAFAVRLEGLSLLPGKYHVRLHTLDTEGLRLFDTLQNDIVVAGETRDYGLVGLPHRWEHGRGARP